MQEQYKQGQRHPTSSGPACGAITHVAIVQRPNEPPIELTDKLMTNCFWNNEVHLGV